MLNRRILRVKAFQNLYSYSQCRSSNLNLAKDYIRESFLPDLNSMETQDRPQLKIDAETTVNIFQKNLANHRLISATEHNSKIKSTAIKAINQFHQANLKDLEFLRKNMVTSAESIPQLYLYAIEMLVAFGDHVRNEYARKRKLSGDAISATSGELNLASNKVLQYLKNAPQYQAELIRQDVNIDDLEQELKEWFREYVKPHEAYQAYMRISSPNMEEDAEILAVILKKIIFKNEVILNFFIEKDLNWSENKSIVKSLASKVLKNIGESVDSENFELPELAINWEEDKEFFQNIFNLTIENDEDHKELISEKTKNWDIERVAITDKIIISMALTEMTNFPSIPVKVTINEYIDISKTYSTPKSKQFVNGLLDVLSKELTESGKIRKSGRGLIDNK